LVRRCLNVNRPTSFFCAVMPVISRGL
jgi:hypothetical protein